ncbi:EF-TU receptor, partial [Prunus dulcis]
MEVCVIAKCTYKSETIMFSVSSESSMDLCGSSDFCVNKELIACEKGESSCSSIVEDRNEFLGRSKRASAKPLLSNEWETYIHHVGQKFDGGAEEFRLKLCKYALEVGFNFLYAGNDKKRVVAVCSNKKLEGCSWRVYASRCEATGSFVIRTLNNVHTCAGRIWESKSKMMRSRVVSSLIVDRIRAKPELNQLRLYTSSKIIMSKYKGQLLCASGKNGNQGFYPLAFGVVDSETEENWTWFLQHLASILLPMGRVVTFFSDRNQGLLNAMGFVFPGWPHSYCYYHLKQNLISKYPKSGYGKLLQDRVINLFSRCAYAVTEEEFKVAMEELVIVGSSKVKAFISDLSRDHYANAFFKGMRYGEMANSLAESFNNWVGVFRDLPVLPLIEGIRQKLMVLNSQRRIEAEKWTTVLCPEMETRLCENAEAGRTWAVRRSNCTVFEVFADYSVMVDLEQRTCSCRLWQI